MRTAAPPLATPRSAPLPPPARKAGKAVIRAFGSATAPARPLPDFLVVGTKRGGTTSLYRHLLRHPHVMPMFPAATHLPMRKHQKGVHFFDNGFDRGVAWYRGHFPTTSHRRRTERRVEGPVVCGEASPYYLFHPLAAARAARVVPHAKVVVLLRDPVERTFSHYKERCREGAETLTFEAALEAEPDRLRGEEERIRRDAGYASYAHEHQSYASQSEYWLPLSAWLEHFPREQLHVVASEAFFARPQDVYDEVAGFLGVPPHELPDTTPLNATAPAELAPSVRRSLVERFAESNAAVEAALGTSFPWARP